jgi:hypothetical protein
MKIIWLKLRSDEGGVEMENRGGNDDEDGSTTVVPAVDHRLKKKRKRIRETNRLL